MRHRTLRVPTTIAPGFLIVAWMCSGFACSDTSGAPGSGSGGGTGSNGSLGGSTSSGGGVSSGGGTGSSGSNTGSAISGRNTSGSGSSSGSTSGGGPDASGPPSICDGAGTRVLTSAQTFVDDFEECAISPGWSSFNDVMPAHDVFKIGQGPGGAVGTAHCGHYAGTGAIVTSAGGFGVGTVYNAAIDPAAKIYCIDISTFDGVSFWAKAATAGSKISLNFVLPQTNAQSKDAQGRANGGDCVMNCYNHPRATVTLTADWAPYAIKFSDAAGGSARVGSLIQQLAWLSPDSRWDFSIDEISFYNGAPPAGAVGPGPDPCPRDGGAGD
jgi:hypothetical protein